MNVLFFFVAFCFDTSNDIWAKSTMSLITSTPSSLIAVSEVDPTTEMSANLPRAINHFETLADQSDSGLCEEYYPRLPLISYFRDIGRYLHKSIPCPSE